VNLIVAEDLGNVPMSEVKRVLAPRGVLYLDGKRTQMPWPEGMDEWPQYLHGADNNAVSRDQFVGPPRRMQWVASPGWMRSHMTMPSFTSLVTARGRLFSIEDLASIENPYLPGQHALVARDAFNGIALWRHPLPTWEPITRYTKGMLVQLQRRLVAVGDQVYSTPGLEEPVAVFDAATGKILKTFPGTARTQEFVYDNGVLYLVIGDRVNTGGYKEFKKFEGSAFREGYNKELPDVPVPKCELRAVDAASGKTIWKVGEDRLTGYVAASVAVWRDRVVYATRKDVVCLDRKSGDAIWKAPLAKASKGFLLGTSPPTLVLSQETAFLADGSDLRAFSLQDGKEKWQGSSTGNYRKGPDLFAIGEQIWTGKLVGHDARTGKVVRELEQRMQRPMSHDRCYRNFITEKYYINSKTGGADFVALDGSGEYPNPWVRGICGLGVLPANGMIYAPPYSCNCVIGSMLSNFNALYADPPDRKEVPRVAHLEKGPAFGSALSSVSGSKDWPTYRHDAGRSGTTNDHAPAKLRPIWRARLSSLPSAPVVADSKVFVADVNAHSIRAFNAANGSAMWTFVAGGRIDSPPTYYRGRLVFGCRDGWVYCLASNDGRLVWRFRDLPHRKICAFGQLESAWPVSGSVLVMESGKNDGAIAYFAAGRSTFLDGGIFVYGLDVETGTIVYERQMAAHLDNKGFPKIRAGNGPPARLHGFKGDILVADAERLYCRHQPFKLDLTPLDPSDVKAPHIICSAGFLDPVPQHRTYWTIDTDVHYAFPSPFQPRWAEDVNPQGDILIRDGNSFYEVRGFTPARHSLLDARKGYRLYAGTICSNTKPPPDRQEHRENPPKKRKGRKTARNGRAFSFRVKWDVTIPLTGKALAKAGNTLLVAGTPLQLEDDAAKAYESAYSGRMGGVLWAGSAVNGEKIASYRLDAAPAWDGIAIAGGRLYVSLQNGTIQCFGD
jgi:outer membrane protein assembly factor BamB